MSYFQRTSIITVEIVDNNSIRTTRISTAIIDSYTHHINTVTNRKKRLSVRNRRLTVDGTKTIAQQNRCKIAMCLTEDLSLRSMRFG